MYIHVARTPHLAFNRRAGWDSFKLTRECPLVNYMIPLGDKIAGPIVKALSGATIIQYLALNVFDIGMSQQTDIKKDRYIPRLHN